MFSIRKGLVLLGVALAACGGPRNAPSPLYLASVEGSGDQVEARLHVEDNTIVLTGYLPGGCRPAGNYVVNGHSISMRLTGSPAGTACPAGGAPMYTTRVGPLPRAHTRSPSLWTGKRSFPVNQSGSASPDFLLRAPT